MARPKGYIRLSRKILSDAWWEPKRPRTRFEAWVDLIFFARFTPGEEVFEGHTVALDRGQFVASERFLAERWSWSRKAVRSFLAEAHEKARIRAHAKAHAGAHAPTVYVIVNYNLYNPRNATEAHAGAHARARSGPTKGTKENKRDNKGENKGKNTDPPTPHGSVDRPDLSYTIRCTVAANQGFRDNLILNGRYEIPASTQTAPLEWQTQGVPVEIAERACYAVAADFKPKPGDGMTGFASLAYCARAVRRAWADEQARRALEGEAAPPRLSLVRPEPAGDADPDAPYGPKGGTDARYEQLCELAWRGVDMSPYPDWPLYRPAYRAEYRTPNQRAREARRRGTIRSAG